MKKISIFLLTIFISINAHAYRVLDVCATYANTGKSYTVQGNIYSGSELNSKTGSSNYNFTSTYVVIFWSDNQASVIELDYYYGSLNLMGSSGRDQQGYRWNIKERNLHLFC